jgi:hypothetical protein
MIEPSGGPCFALEAAVQLWVGKHLGVWNFQRHLAAQPRIEGEMHNAKTAATQLTADFEAAERPARGHWQR